MTSRQCQMTTNVQRVQFDIAEDRVKEIDALKELTGTETRKDLLNNALTLLEWAIGEIAKGRSIASVSEKDDSYRELQMPIFGVAKKRAAQAQKSHYAAARG